jgi:hypothetical protein
MVKSSSIFITAEVEMKEEGVAAGRYAKPRINFKGWRVCREHLLPHHTTPTSHIFFGIQ